MDTDKFRPGNWIELIPVDPPAQMPDSVLVGEIAGVDVALREFRIFAYAQPSGVLDFVLESGGMARSRYGLYRVGRHCTPEEWHTATFQQRGVN